jgi:hypothetical protein
MYRRSNSGQISIAEFYLPLVGTLDLANRWVKMEEQAKDYSPQFNATICAPSNPVRLAFGVLNIK